MDSKLPLVLAPQELAPHLKDANILVVDVSSADNFAKAHIPGARHLLPSELVCGEQPATGKLPNETQLRAMLNKIGFDGSQHIIACDDEGGGWAGRLIWTLDVLGYKDYSFLDGGILAWKADGFACESGAYQAPDTDVAPAISIDRTPIITLEEIVDLLGDNSIAIWDARSPEEYAGTKVVAQRGGHIPGAVNYEWTDAMDKQRDLRLLPLPQIQAKLDSIGISKDKQIIVHCQTHHRSGLSYLIAKILAYPNIKAYDGSWSEWGNRDDTPIET